MVQISQLIPTYPLSFPSILHRIVPEIKETQLNRGNSCDIIPTSKVGFSKIENRELEVNLDVNSVIT
jgi:hypothetical protein